MEQLFTWLSRAVEGSAGLALCAAFTWGVLSIVLSCYVPRLARSAVVFCARLWALDACRQFGNGAAVP